MSIYWIPKENKNNLKKMPLRNDLETLATELKIKKAETQTPKDGRLL